MSVLTRRVIVNAFMGLWIVMALVAVFGVGRG
jgi:hypothetical protein